MGKTGITVKFMGVLKPIKYKGNQELVVKFPKKYMNFRPHLGILKRPHLQALDPPPRL